MSGATLAVVLLVAAVGLGMAGAIGLRMAGARPGFARRLAGPREIRVGRLQDEGFVAHRPVRVVGRIRCREPMQLTDGERLVAFHRDVEVRVAGRWRPLERIRESRSFELWDHDGSVTVDPSRAAEPLVTIPKVWRGDAAELEEPHASAAARLAERDGTVTAARAVTRSINVTDRLSVVARPVRDADGRVRLAPPTGGYIVSALALDDAMRLLGGAHRRVAAASVVVLGAAGLLAAAGLVVAAASLVSRS